MSRFEVDSDAMMAAAAATQRSIAGVEAEVNGMLHNLEALQGSWRGQAAATFADLTSQWRATQMRVQESLQSIQAALAHAGAQYADVESANARMFAG